MAAPEHKMAAPMRLVKRVSSSPSAMTTAAVGARAFAFLAPIPFLTAQFPTEAVALWLVILTFQAFATAVIGTLPTILMQMVSYANAGSSRLGGHLDTKEPSSAHSPNQALLRQLACGLLVVFGASAVIWIFLASTVGTWLLWRPYSLSGVGATGFVAWAIFIAAMALRLYMQTYMTYLLGRNRVAEVRRLEAATWIAGGAASAAVFVVYPNFALAMAVLQAPVLVNLILLRRMAYREGFRTSSWKEVRRIGLLGEVAPRAIRGGIGLAMSMVAVYGSGVFYAQIGAPESVAAFTFALNIIGMINQLANAPMTSALPALAGLLARGDHTQRDKKAERAMLISLSFFVLAVITVPPVIYLVNLMLPAPLAFVEPALWAAFAGANFLFRYGALHLHFYTTTNDIRWHIIDGVNACLFLGILWGSGATSAYAFPLAQAMALMCFYVPYARWLTLKRYSFSLIRDLRYAVMPTITVLLFISFCTLVSAKLH